MDGLDILNTVAELNIQLDDVEQGIPSSWFQFRSDGREHAVWFAGYPIWTTNDGDTRAYDDSQEDGKEPLRGYLIREAKNIVSVAAKLPL